MPRQELLTVDEFNELETSILGMQYRTITEIEFVRDRQRLGLVGTGKKKGWQEKYSYQASGLKATLLTTFVRELGTCRKHDKGCIVVTNGDTILYMTRPIHRTKNFAKRILAYAEIIRDKMINSPLCPECSARMRIRSNDKHQHWWSCGRLKSHAEGNWHNEPWDFGIDDIQKAFLDKMRAPGVRRRKKAKKEGKEIVRKTQKSHWIRTNPQNIEAA